MFHFSALCLGSTSSNSRRSTLRTMSLPYSLAAFQANTCAGPFLTSPSTISKSRDLEMWTPSFHSQHTSSLESFCSGQCVLTSNQCRQLCNVDVRLASHTHGLAHSTHSQTDTWQHESTDLPDRSFRNGALCGDGEDGQGEVASESVVDMVTLGNMCVDVFVDVEELPPEEREAKLLYMQKLVEAPPDEVLSDRKVHVRVRICVTYKLCVLRSLVHSKEGPYHRHPPTNICRKCSGPFHFDLFTAFLS